MPTPQRGRESIEIAAPSEVVYDLLADITQHGRVESRVLSVRVARRGYRR
jgi:hypothetical protein